MQKETKKTSEPTITKKVVKEVIEYDYNGSKVGVEIDHDRGIVSLVDLNTNLNGKYQTKSYVFANRGLKYMAGWKNIIKVMEYAIDESIKILEKTLAEDSRLSAENLVKIIPR